MQCRERTCSTGCMPWIDLQYASDHWSPPKLAYLCWCLWASTWRLTSRMPSVVIHGTCQHNYTVEREDWLSTSVVNRSIVTDPSIRQPGFDLPCHTWSLPDRPNAMSCKSPQMGFYPVTLLWLWPATDHEPHSRHMPTNKIRRRTENTPQHGIWPVLKRPCVTREIKTWLLNTRVG